MILKVFSVYDSKLGAYMQPFYFQSLGQATRAFADLVADKNTMVGKHPEDFILFEIAAFDDNSANFVSCAPKSLGCALEYVCKE